MARDGQIDGETEGGTDDPYEVKVKIEDGHYDSAMVKLERLEDAMLDADGNVIPGEYSQYAVDQKQMIADLLPKRRKLKQKRAKDKPAKQKQKRVVKKIKTIKAYDYGKEFLCPICGKSLKVCSRLVQEANMSGNNWVICYCTYCMSFP